MSNPPKPEALARRLVYQSRWVNLYVDRVLFPNGKIIEQHHLLDFDHDAVMAVVQGPDGRYLMVQVPRYPTGRAEWEFPAGSIELDENPITAAERELREETGYSSTSHELLYEYHPLNGIANQVFYIVRCRVTGDPGDYDTGEISGVRWVSMDEIWQQIRNGAMKDGYTLLAFLLDRHI